MGNIFDFPNPEKCYCRILGYMRSHSFMEIRVDCTGMETSPKVFYVAFEGVEYFDGSTIWQGGQFRVMPPADCLDLLHKLGRYEGVADEYLLQRFQLITISEANLSKSNLHVRILAANSSVSTSPSPYFPTTSDQNVF